MNLRKWAKVLTVMGLLLFLFALPVNAATSKSITLVDQNANHMVNKFKFRAMADSNVKDLLKNYDVKGQELKFLLDKNNVYDSIIISSDNLDSKPDVLKKVAGMVGNGNEVYVYGDSLDLSAVKAKVGINEKKVTDEKAIRDNPVEDKLNVIGFNNGEVVYTEKVTVETNEGTPLKGSADIHLQGVLNHKEKSKTQEGSLTAADYGSDTVVKSSYNNKATYYAPDIYGNQILRASLNVDWILKQNTANDNDPNYDYFYIRDNAEFITYSGKGAISYNQTANHTLPWPSSDNVLEWGPDSTSNVSQVTVGLPWSVSWAFSLGGTLDIDTSGSQTYDKVDWTLHNYQIWTDYSMPDTTRIQPGTAWASYGTYAGIDLTNKGKFTYGGSDKYLTVNQYVRYDY